MDKSLPFWASVHLSSFNTRLLAQMIIEAAENTAPYFLRALTTQSTVTPQDVLPQIKLELCVLYLHLFDREVFHSEGVKARDVFADSLFDCLSKKISNKAGVDVQKFADFCNERQIEYSRYKQLFWTDQSKPRGTLFWEFAMKMGFAYQGYNPIALQLFAIATAEIYTGLLQAADKIVERGSAS